MKMPSSPDLRPLLRSAAPPLVFLGVLLAFGELSFEEPRTESAETSLLVGSLGAAVWLLAAVVVTGCRLRREMLAHQRLQELRDRTQASGRALVHVQTVVSSSGAGQHAVVVNVATGFQYRLWLPEVNLPIGAYAVIEQRAVGVAVIDWVGPRTVDAAHRDEQRVPAHIDIEPRSAGAAETEQLDDAHQLITEVETYLKQR